MTKIIICPQKHSPVKISFSNEIYFICKSYNLLSIFSNNLFLLVILLFPDELNDFVTENYY